MGYALFVLEFHAKMPDRLSLGTWLSGTWLGMDATGVGADASPLRAVAIFIALIFMSSLVHAISLWGLYQLAFRHTQERVLQLYREVFRKSSQLALAKSISGQQATLREATEQGLPKVSAAWEAWLRCMPRHFVQAALCFLLALCIHPLITFLTAIGILLLSLLYRMLEQRSRTRVPVLRERAASLNRRIRELCETGPLLDFVHAGEAAGESLETQLRSLQQAENSLILTRSWKTPLMAFAITIVACLVSFVLSVRILSEDANVDLASAITLCALLAGTTFAILRIERTWETLTEGNQSASSLLALFDQPDTSPQGDLLKQVDPLASRLVLESVTLKDNEGKKLLEDVSLSLAPGQLVAVVGNNRLQAKALAELLLGFGRPSSGRMLLDDTNTIDIAPQAFRAQCAWIAADGPLVPGTIEDNLHANGRPASLAELMDALRAANAYDAIQNLPDGLATLVAPHDDRLAPDYLFRLGVARTLAKRPMLVVAEEPFAQVRPEVESQTLAALRQLTDRGVLVVTLPERLTTLRDADMIVVMHDHRVNAVGTHTQLLQSCELYRHLNYLRFSELRHVGLQ